MISAEVFLLGMTLSSSLHSMMIYSKWSGYKILISVHIIKEVHSWAIVWQTLFQLKVHLVAFSGTFKHNIPHGQMGSHQLSWRLICWYARLLTLMISSTYCSMFRTWSLCSPLALKFIFDLGHSFTKKSHVTTEQTPSADEYHVIRSKAPEKASYGFFENFVTQDVYIAFFGASGAPYFNINTTVCPNTLHC